MDVVNIMESCLLVIMKVEIVKNMNSRLLINMKDDNVKSVLFLVKISVLTIDDSPESQ